jgi:hypothetical protein
VPSGRVTVFICATGVARVLAYEPEMKGLPSLAASAENIWLSGVPQLKNISTEGQLGSAFQASYWLCARVRTYAWS